MAKIETTAIVCTHVFTAERSVAVVIHHSDGVWQLVCGKDDHAADVSAYETVGLEHILERQNNLHLVACIDRSMMAEFDGANWSISPYDDD